MRYASTNAAGGSVGGSLVLHRDLHRQGSGGDHGSAQEVSVASLEGGRKGQLVFNTVSRYKVSLSLYAWSVKANTILSWPNRDPLPFHPFLSPLLSSFPTFLLTWNETAGDEANLSTLVNTHKNPLKKLVGTRNSHFNTYGV